MLIHVQGRLKANKGQRRSTIHNTLHHHTPQYVMLLFYAYNRFHWSEYTWQVTHASLDINTTSNYCPVSLARVAQLVERRTPDSEAPGSNPKNTQLFFFFFSSFVESLFNTTQKKPFKEKKKKNFQFECQF